jgi:CHAD domain-containing protein
MAASLTRALGAVRDRDVLIESLEKYARKAPDEERPGIEDIVRTVRDEREVYRATMLQVLDEIDQAGFRQHLYVVLMHEGSARAKKGDLDPSATLRENARQIAVKRAADLYDFVPYIYDPAKMAELHEMRIGAKHLRYALEIFRVCFGQDIEDRIGDIKSVQEQIGNIHDCDVMVELLRRHLSVIAQRHHQELAAIAGEPGPHDARMAHLREAIRMQMEADPRLGILSLLSQKSDERQRRYTEFVRWWDAQQANNMRGKLYSCIAAVHGLKEQHQA